MANLLYINTLKMWTVNIHLSIANVGARGAGTWEVLMYLFLLYYTSGVCWWHHHIVDALSCCCCRCLMGLGSKSVSVFLGIITRRRCWSSPLFLLWSKVTRAVLIWSCRVAENESWTVEGITWRGEINISAALPVCTDHHKSLFGSIQNVGSLTWLTLFPINTSYHMLAKVTIWKRVAFSFCWTANKQESTAAQTFAHVPFKSTAGTLLAAHFCPQMYADVCFRVAKKKLSCLK